MKGTKLLVMMLLVGLLASGSLFAGGGGESSASSGPQKWRWGQANPDGVPLNDGAKRFAQLLREETKNAISVDVYAQAQLGNDRDLIEGVGLGSLELCSVTGALTNFSAAFLTFDLPYIVKNNDAGLRKAFSIFDGPVGREVLDTLEAKDIKGLGFWESGFRHCINSKKDIRTPADIQGMKIRTMENELHLAYYRAVGAMPVAIASSEAFTALRQGVIDGMDNNLFSFLSQKPYEVAKHISLTGHVYSPGVVLMHLGLYKSLPDDHRKIIDRLIKEVGIWQREHSLQFDKKAIEELKKFGCTIIEDIDYDVWQNACSKVYDEYRGKINQKYLDAFLK